LIPTAVTTQVDYLPLGLAIDPSLAGDPTDSITLIATSAAVDQDQRLGR
jgi:hypothetical protein